MFLISLNHFRAIAIVFIVSGHFLPISNIEFDSFIERLIFNLISGGTGLFVFISGFLFHYVFYKKFQYKTFITKKLKNVFIPYLILGLVPVLYYVLSPRDFFDGMFLPLDDSWIERYIVPTIKYYWTGRFFTAYWYIPFIIVTFILAPIHIKFIKQSMSLQVFIMLFMSLISIYMHRPVDNLSVFQSVIYFQSIYFIGIFCSLHHQSIYEKAKGKEYYLFIIVILIACLQTYLGNLGNYHKTALDYSGIDLMFIQKVFLSLFFMIWLHRFEHVNNKFLHLLASTSFTIFFIHPIFLWILSKVSFIFSLGDPWLTSIVIIITVVFTCIITALVMKKILPKMSRYIIGY
jgi:hypothetical protein